MQRRKFLKQLATLGAAPILLNGVPVRIMANSLAAQVNCSEVNDRILVVIQLHGGNDGLNTLVPLNHYSTYANMRSNLALPNSGSRSIITLDNTLPNTKQLGLHPDLGAFKSLYDDGLMSIIQNAGYANNNRSHFQAKDDWLTGSDSQIQKSEGWMGRFLDYQYPGYPEQYPSPLMPDPLGLEFGTSTVSLGFHHNRNGAMALAMKSDPSGFYSLVSGVGGLVPSNIPNTHYGDKLQHIISVQQNTNSYAQRIDQLYQNGSNHSSVTYPTNYHSGPSYQSNNELAPQLKAVARLISGGIQTKIFWVRLTGFDTHINQVDWNDPTSGQHAVLLYNLSQAVKAFQDDLKAQGLEDRVMTVTFSEFGRRVAQNGSLGTDHGTYAPMFVFGKHVNPGVLGNNANLSNLSNNDLSVLDHDYRRVFVTLLQDWLGADNAAVSHANLSGFLNQKMSLIDSNEVAPTGCYLTPLPVTLVSFDAHPQADNTVLCEWRTQQERDNKAFVVERSKDGERFEEMARIAGAGTTDDARGYKWVDPAPHKGVSYYRLKQIDYNGAFSYQPKVAVHLLPVHDELTYQVHPNPATDHFVLDLFTSQPTNGDLRIANMKGQTLYSQRMDIERGSSRHFVPCEQLNAGVYLVHVATGIGENVSFRLVVK